MPDPERFEGVHDPIDDGGRRTVERRCATMRVVVHRRARRPPEPERPPSFKTSLTLVFEICIAGARPNRIPVSRQMAVLLFMVFLSDTLDYRLVDNPSVKQDEYCVSST